MLNIVIPMAGKGSRFSNEGYTTRKPFLYFRNTFMIYEVMENLKPLTQEHIFYLIMNKVDFENETEKISLIKNNFNVKIKIIDYYTEGPVMTILHIREFINNNDQLLIANSDQYVDFSIDVFLEKSKKYDGSLLSFIEADAEPKWSFIESNKNKIVKRVIAKKCISDEVVVGIYYWKKGKDFVDAAIELIINNDRANGEFFQCPVYNYAITKGKKIYSYIINKEQMYALGVPIDYKESIKKINEQN